MNPGGRHGVGRGGGETGTKYVKKKYEIRTAVIIKAKILLSTKKMSAVRKVL